LDRFSSLVRGEKMKPFKTIPKYEKTLATFDSFLKKHGIKIRSYKKVCIETTNETFLQFILNGASFNLTIPKSGMVKVWNRGTEKTCSVKSEKAMGIVFEFIHVRADLWGIHKDKITKRNKALGESS
jgi:hypothetical protein